MTNLINKIFGEKEWFNFKEVEPFFKGFGIDLESVGFPSIKDRNEIPTMAYHINFSDLKAELIRDIENRTYQKVYTKISGFYSIQAVASTRDKDGNWHPGTSCDYKFNIINGKLNLKQK